MMLLAPLLCLTLLGPQPGMEGPRTWEDVELPVGFYLDLGTGTVSNLAPVEAVQALTWDGESLLGPALLSLIPGASERDRIERGEGGAPQPGVMTLVGSEWCYELGELGWGYLRVLAVGAGRITMERAHLSGEELLLSREPAGLSWRARPEGVELSWGRSDRESARWIIERRALRAERVGAWEAAGTSTEPWWTDAEVEPDVLMEYRVVLEGGGMGSRTRAIAGGVVDGPVEVGQGDGVNVLTGEVGGARVDIQLEYINPKGVQIGPGEGVLIRALVANGRDAWELPPKDTPGYGPQRFFLSEGRDLALYLPEGLYARLSLGEIKEEKAQLKLSAAIDGGRVLLPTPMTLGGEGLPEGGASVKASVPGGFLGLGLGEPILSLEREQGYDSEEWVFVTEDTTGGEALLIDPNPGITGPCRYRTRLRLGPHGPSAPSVPISVLVGDDGGEQTEAWIREAITELGQPDYARRQRARELLAVVGERARPQLLEVVSSENPEQAAAARELLSGLGNEDAVSAPAEALVPELLLKRANELGLDETALPGFLDPDPLVRAFGAFKVRDVEQARAHLEVLAEVDPEGFVRDVASIALLLPPRVESPGVRAHSEGLELIEVARELELMSALDPIQLADSLQGAVSEAEVWTRLLVLQVVSDLEASFGDLVREEEAIARARLVLALLEDRLEGREAPGSFLAAALDVVRDPMVRQVAARRLGERLFQEPRSLQEPLRVEPGDFDELASILDECRRSGVGETILVPAGVYEAESGSLSTLRTGGEGVHLIGEGEVFIHASFIIDEGAKVTLENLKLKPRSGVGVTILGGELLLKDCELSSSSMGVQATDSVVTLSSCVLGSPASSKGGRGGPILMRFVGVSALFARESELRTTASCLQGPRMVYLDTCALSSRDRSAVEGQGRLEVFCERSILRGGYAALVGAGSGVLDGVVLESVGHAALRLGENLHICREHTSGGDEPGELWSKGVSTDSTLERR
ncbi:MAG: hypothetical protein MK297_07255 [Planctomycetes bacterium]|nr:hypothetical protein [Planctomycetota bacterium]